MLDGKRVLITGGSGSLGSSLVRDLLQKGHPPEDITILARNETKINQFRSRYPKVRCEVGDVRDLTWLQTIFPGHNYIVHAGALKVILTAEVNVRETVLTNVIGSMNVALAAAESGAERVIGVSTDKVCQAQVMYGASKMLLEGLFREANGWSSTSFNLVRYGNVLYSNQSVAVLFESLIQQNKPLTVTRYDMTRFWISMQDALDLIWDALLWEESGITLIPKAKASDMLTLAEAMIPHKDYPIIETGKRPGEKMHEKMIHAGETYHTKECGKYFVLYHPAKIVDSPLPEGYEYTSNTCEQYTVEELKNKLAEYSYA